jgi:hypothetical protein
MNFSEWIKLQEMPITGMHFLPKKNWPELDKHQDHPASKLNSTPEQPETLPQNQKKSKSAPQYGFGKDDIGILTHPAGQNKIINKFKNATDNFEIYFVRVPSGRDHLETGEVSEEWVQKNLGVNIPTDEDKITVVYASNSSAERMPMTAWTIAHRYAHSVYDDYGFNEFTEHVDRTLFDWMEEVYGRPVKVRIDKSRVRGDTGHKFDRRSVGLDYENNMRYLAMALGTMKSCRDKELRTYLEFKFELVAQYLTTGHIKLNPLPREFGPKGWGRQTIWSRNEKVRQEINEDMEGNARGFEQMLEMAMGNHTGRIFVM